MTKYLKIGRFLILNEEYLKISKGGGNHYGKLGLHSKLESSCGWI
jgi:hypothetical protein